MKDDAQTWYQRGLDARRAKDLTGAVLAFAQATALSPNRVSAWNSRAAVLSELGRDDESAAVLSQAVEATNGDASILANLAMILERLGRFEASVAAAEQAIAIAPDNVVALQTLGVALLALGRTGGAVSACRRLTELRPAWAPGCLNLGEALMAADAYDQALVAYGQALALTPELFEARIGQALAMAMLGRFGEADAAIADMLLQDAETTLACFGRMAAGAHQRVPPHWRPRAVEVFLSRLWAQQQVCDWRRRDAYVEELHRYAQRLSDMGEPASDQSLAFQSLALAMPAPLRRGLLDAVAAGVGAGRSQAARQRRVRRMDGPIRLGFLSADFREHPVAQLHWRQLCLHDRSRFSISAYSLVDDPGSPMRQRVAASADRFRDLSRSSVEEAAWRIARDGIDILVDLSGYLDHARPEILAMRPAPVVVAYQGSPLSMGRSLVDYRIADRVSAPDGGEFTEAVVRLPATHFLYNDQESIAAVPSRQDCGLPREGLVFCAFNSGFKIEPTIFGLWMDLLQRVPGSTLWLRDEGPAMRDHLRREADARHVNAERLVFAPWLDRPAHLARHACADLFLDTLYCNAHTTAADALWAGLPVLTCAGDTLASRLGASIVQAAGLPELVAASPEEYLLLAHRLATSPNLLADLRDRLRKHRNSLPLFATERRVRDLERAFSVMWRRHCDGAPPVSFDLDAADR